MEWGAGSLTEVPSAARGQGLGGWLCEWRGGGRVVWRPAAGLCRGAKRGQALGGGSGEGPPSEKLPERPALRRDPARSRPRVQEGHGCSWARSGAGT